MLNTIIAFMFISGSLFDLIPFIDQPHWNPSWPIFKDNPQFMPIWKGYGDWCPESEGPHPGLDFDAWLITDSVLAPNDSNGYSGDIYIDPLNPDPGYMMCFLESLDDEYGWGLGHLDILDPNAEQFHYPTSIFAKRPMAPAQPPTGSHVWRHVHLSWVPKLDPDPTTDFVGLFNPFDYLQAPSGYDEVRFDKIPYMENIYTHTSCGIWFNCDQIEEPLEFPAGERSLPPFQSRIYGSVDIVARPYSYYLVSAQNYHPGVRSVSHNILKQNPYNGSYNPLPEDIYGARTLVSFDGLIPYGPSPYYNAIFFDPAYHPSDPLVWDFRNSYIVTNCGKDQVGANGFDNIWTGPLSHDWNASPPKFNQGGWDTRLRSPSIGGSAERPKAHVNEHAAFPDGRYAVEITAESQGNSMVSSRILPSCRVEVPTAPIKGIIVDNYRPHVESVNVYQCPENIVLYSAEWITDYANPLDSTRLYDPMDDWSYLAQDTAHTLFVYTIYSEPIDSSSTGNVWLTAGNQFETIWSSLDSDGVNCLNPIPLIHSTPSGSQAVSRETDDGSFWVGYESNVPFPGRYVGELTLHISGPRDLANNSIDSDASTVAYPRDGTGYFPSFGYEAGIDSSYSWGAPLYWAMPGMPYNYYVVGKRYNGGPSISGTGMYLDSLSLAGHSITGTTGPGYGQDSRKGWCAYWAGFWLCKEPRIVTDSIYIVKPVVGEGLYNGWDIITFDLPIPYEMWYAGWPPYPHSMCCGCISTHTGNHCFVGWSNKLTPSSSYESYITCISAISNCIAEPEYLGSGISGIYGGAGDTIRVHHGGNILYFVPEDFFPEEKNIGDNHQASEVIEDGPGVVYYFSLAAPSPNPFAVSSVFSYTLASSETASLDVYDVSGRIVRNLASGEHLSGTHSVTWAGDNSDGSPIPGGIYLLRLTSGGETAVRSCVVIR